MLAGGLLALICLVIMESFIVAVRIAHEENGMVLAADGYAMDAAWTLLNGSYEAWPLNSELSNQSYTITNRNTVLYNPSWPAPMAYITCRSATAGTNATVEAGKLIAVNVVWGPRGKRRQLWGTAPCENGVTTIYDRNHAREVFRALDIDRGEKEVD